MLHTLDKFLSSLASCEDLVFTREGKEKYYIHSRSNLRFEKHTDGLETVFLKVLLYPEGEIEDEYYVPQLGIYVVIPVDSMNGTVKDKKVKRPVSIADLSLIISANMSESDFEIRVKNVREIRWSATIASELTEAVRRDITVRPIDLYLPMEFGDNQQICIGSSIAMLGASKSGKSTLVSHLLKSNLNEVKNLDNVKCKVRMVKALIVADEPPLNTLHWLYPKGMDYSFVIYSLNQDKIKSIINYLSLVNQARENEMVLINIVFDSISELLYTPDDTDNRAGSTFVKGISSKVRGYLLSFSQMAGYVVAKGQIITLIATVNIPSSGKLEDERAFVNYVSGSTIATYYLAGSKISEHRDRIQEFMGSSPNSSNKSGSGAVGLESTTEIGLKDSLHKYRGGTTDAKSEYLNTDVEAFLDSKTARIFGNTNKDLSMEGKK